MEPLERVGLEPGEPRRHRPAGGAVGAQPGRVLDGLDDRRHPGRIGERVVERGDPLRRQRRAPWRCRRPSWSRSAAARTSASRRARVAFFSATRLAICFFSSSMPQPLRALTASTGTPARPSASSSRRTSSSMPSRRVLGHGVDVVEDDQHDVLVGRQRREVAVVDRGVGVLLRVEHPHEHVGELHQPVDLEVVRDLGRVVVGQVEEHDALAARCPRLPVDEHRVARHLVARAGCRATRAARRRPRGPTRTRSPTRSWDGGRRRPTSSSSVSALKVDDLPEPVAPASATTVWSADEPQPAGGAVDDGPGVVDDRGVDAPRGAVDCLLETLTRVPISELPRDQLLGPLEQGRHGLPRRRSEYDWVSLVVEVDPPDSWSARSHLSVPRAARRNAGRRPGVTPARSFVGRLGRDLEAVEQVEVAPALAAEQLADRRLQVRRARSARVRTAWSPKTASSSFCPSTAEPPAMPASAPVTPAVCAKTTTISATESPLTPNARKRAVERLSAPSLRTMSRTSDCQSRTARSASRRKSREARPRSSPASVEQDLPGRHRLPRRLGPLGGGLGVLEDQRLQPGLDGDGHPLGLLRLALDGVDDAVAQPADARLERPEQLAGADELLPAREHLAAQQGAVGGGFATISATAWS